MTVRRYIIPEPAQGYAIGGKPGYWSGIKAEATENLIANPSFERVDGMGVPVGYTATLGPFPPTLTQSTEWQRRGLYSCKVVAAAGGLQYEIGLTAGQVYTFSLDLKGSGRNVYSMYFADNVGNQLSGTTTIKSRGRVQRPWITYTAVSTATHRLYLEKTSGLGADLFYTDGWQLEKRGYPTTYCDGDLRGFVLNRQDYYWRGAPHASASIRIGQSRAGGRVYKFGDYGFSLLGMTGLGQNGVLNYTSPLSSGGAYYYGSNITERAFTLTGAIEAPRGLEQLHRYRAGLEDIFTFENTVPEQPMLLRYFPYDCGEFEDEYVEITALPENGMSGNLMSEYQERVAIPFTLYTPYTARKWGDVGSELDYELSVSNANLAMKRDANGVWSAVDVDAATRVLCYQRMQDGKYVVGGEFPSADSVANTEGIAIYDPDTDTFTAMGTGGPAGTIVRALAMDAMGDVYAVGDFPSMGGVANTLNMAKWDFSASAWVSIGDADNDLFICMIAQDGLFYAGGSASTFGGTPASRIAYYDGANWFAMGVGFVGTVVGIAQSPADGFIYAGVDADGVYYFDGASWITVGSTGADTALSIAFTPDGRLFATGTFTTIGGTTANYVAYLTGGSWFAIGSGFDDVGRFAFYNTLDGAIYFTGDFDDANGVETPGHVVSLVGTRFVPLDFAPPGTSSVRSFYAVSPDYLFVGFNTAGTGSASAVTPITYSGTAPIGPKIVITGPGDLRQIKNYTTGATLYFSLAILAGETVTLDFSIPSAVTFNSSTRGNLLSTIARGSSLNFDLLRGVNQISLFVQNGTADTFAYILFTPAYSSVDAWALERRLP